MKADASFNRRVMRVFEDMIDQPPEARDAWLDGVCRSEPKVGDAVRAMADASRSSRFLPTSPPEAHDPNVDDSGPARIGHYRVIRELGRGGMGIVYLGERDDGLFEHRVAIKLIRRTLLSERALDRFATERRILARLRHPHIAQMLDGGVTPEGDSYIVMELIDGEAITDYCDRRQLDLKARLHLFREAMDAVDHAHRNLIVHADIKPSNVIVEQGFGAKLLDFGVARLLDDSEDERHHAHTPGYASAARVDGLPATPADDIFAAGRLLGELVEGQNGIDRDLAAVIAKASAEEVDRRYGSIRELLDDLDRWARHLPTRAANLSRNRRAGLYWRRHRLALGLSGLVALGVLIAFAVTLTLYAQSERRRVLADQRYAATRQMADYIIGNVDPALAHVPGTLATRRQLIEQTGAYLASLETSPSPSPALMREIAGGYLRIARIYGLDPSGGIGDLAAAKASLAHGDALIARAAAGEPGSPQLLLLRAQSDLLRGSEVFLSPNAQAAESGLAALLQAQKLFADYLKFDPGNISAQLGLWGSQTIPARDYVYLGRPLEGVALVEAHLDNANMHVANATQRAERDFYLNGSYLLLAEAYMQIDPSRAITYYTKLIDRVDGMQRRGESDWENDFTQSSGLAERAQMKAKLHDLNGAIVDAKRAIANLKRLYMVEGNHSMAAYLAHIQGNLADLEGKAGHWTDARKMSDQSIAWLRQDAVLSPEDNGRKRFVAQALSARAELEDQAKAAAAACSIAKDAVGAWTKVRALHAAMPIDLEPNGGATRAWQIVQADCAPGR